MGEIETIRGKSRLSRLVQFRPRDAAPAETPQPDATSGLNSAKNSTPDRSEAEIREAAADVHGRFLRAERWLEEHDEDHPAWERAMTRLREVIETMGRIEREARDLGVENIFD